MRILATIPALATGADPGGTASGPAVSSRPAPQVGGSRPSARPRRPVDRFRRQPFPLRSLAALAALALVAWSLAHWNDARRLRHQEAAKLADRPPAATAEEAVLR
jgi:hypothetical protein